MEGGLRLLDQTLLPSQEAYVVLRTIPEVVDALQRLVVRGAPAIGCAAAYAMVLELERRDTAEAWMRQLELNGKLLKDARPTAVNLAVGVDCMLRHAKRIAREGAGVHPREWTRMLLAQAHAFHAADEASCLGLSEHAQPLLHDGARILTHCNAGALATGGIGTALGPIHLAASRGMRLKVYADETRPLRQGARISAWEMARHGIEVAVLPDSAAATLLRDGKVDRIFVGSDRIAANGDVANKIGTYPLAVMAERHGVPFHVLAPATTIDPRCPDGASIPIEQRGAREIYDREAAPQGAQVYNPAFDVTPKELVHSIITEAGSFCAWGEGQAGWEAYVAGLR